jgi:hypothetical protein
MFFYLGWGVGLGLYGDTVTFDMQALMAKLSG